MALASKLFTVSTRAGNLHARIEGAAQHASMQRPRAQRRSWCRGRVRASAARPRGGQASDYCRGPRCGDVLHRSLQCFNELAQQLHAAAALLLLLVLLPLLLPLQLFLLLLLLLLQLLLLPLLHQVAQAQHSSRILWQGQGWMQVLNESLKAHTCTVTTQRC